MIRSVILSTGSYLPEKIVTNSDLEKTLQTSDSWIRERTGITKRHIAAEGEYTSHLAAKAGRKALVKSSVRPEMIDVVLVATATPDETFPGCSARVQQALGCIQAAAFDLQAACSGFVYALTVADSMIRAGTAKHVLVIGAETMSRVVDWTDRKVAILFGDGAGAVVLSAENESKRGILATHWAANGAYADLLHTTGGVSLSQTAGFLQMEGKEVFRHAVECMTESSLCVLDRARIDPEQVKWVVPHQANARILSATAKKLGIDESRVIMTVSDHANTSSASIPLALDHAASQGKIASGDLVLLTALGAGFTWGSVLIRW